MANTTFSVAQKNDLKAAPDQLAERWRSLKLFCFYRIIIALFLLVIAHYSQKLFQENVVQPLFGKATLLYLAFSLFSVVIAWFQWFKLDTTVSTLTIIDILLIILIMHGLGGSSSGVGWLLVVSIASASLLSKGQWALFYAAVASIGVLTEQLYRNLFYPNSLQVYSQPVLIAIGCFATAWLAYSLAKRGQESERLASAREVDLENLEQINALITHQMQDGVLVVDPNYRVKHYNQNALQMLNLEANDLRKHALNQLAPNIAEEIKRWFYAHKPNDIIDLEKINKIKMVLDGRELSLRIMPVDKDHKTGVVIFIQDWSQLQTQAQQLKLAALGRLTANIAHEVRNPLSAISHANQLLQEDDALDTTTKRMLKIIEDNVQRVDQIIKDVLELNRRDRTNQEPITLELFLNEFYMQFCAIEKIDTQNFILQLPIDSHTSVLYDKRHLNQVLWNLCKNGWRHCKKELASLQLRLEITENRLVVIKVIDDGEGVAPHARPNLFEPFFTTVNTGTGLGLYIGKELTEANGANLSYTALEIGSEFAITMSIPP